MELSRNRIILIATVSAIGKILSRKVQFFTISRFSFAANIGWGLLISLQPPFYPQEAEKRGATPSQYGFVFGIASFAAFIFSPIFGKYGAQMGVNLVYNSGAFIQAFCGIAFGLLIYLDSLTAFLSLSYFLRFLDGVADAASNCCGTSLLIKLFPDKAMSIFSWLETLFAFGYMMGPFIGSALYQLGGFLLPFLVIGIWCLFGAFGKLFSFQKITECI